MPVERLSGGERARVHLARLMLQPADLLILDEPTNDLDIPTLEVLEETLIEFAGAVGASLCKKFLSRITSLRADIRSSREFGYPCWDAGTVPVLLRARTGAWQ